MRSITDVLLQRAVSEARTSGQEDETRITRGGPADRRSKSASSSGWHDDNLSDFLNKRSSTMRSQPLIPTGSEWASKVVRGGKALGGAETKDLSAGPGDRHFPPQDIYHDPDYITRNLPRARAMKARERVLLDPESTSVQRAMARRELGFVGTPGEQNIPPESYGSELDEPVHNPRATKLGMAFPLHGVSRWQERGDRQRQQMARALGRQVYTCLDARGKSYTSTRPCAPGHKSLGQAEPMTRTQRAMRARASTFGHLPQQREI